MASERLVQNILQARAGGAVQRCHTVRHLGSYSVAEHSWGVCMLLLQLYPEHFGRLAPYALVHDIPEGLLGDVPSPTKDLLGASNLGYLEDRILRRFDLPALNELTAEEHFILNSCDRLELYLWAREQQEFGNNYVEEVVINLEKGFDEKPLERRAQTYQVQLIQGSVVPHRVGLLKRIQDGK